MRLSKLEPHLVQPSDETSDVRLFLQDLEEGSKTVSKTNENVGLRDEGNGSTDDEVKHGFVRLVDFIAKKQESPYFSLRAVANRAYLRQHLEFAPAGETTEASQAENKEIKIAA